MTKTLFFALSLVVAVIVLLFTLLIGLGLSLSSYAVTNDEYRIIHQTEARYSGQTCELQVAIPVAYSGFWSNRNPSGDVPGPIGISVWYNFSTVGCLYSEAGVQVTQYVAR